MNQNLSTVWNGEGGTKKFWIFPSEISQEFLQPELFGPSTRGQKLNVEKILTSSHSQNGYKPRPTHLHAHSLVVATIESSFHSSWNSQQLCNCLLVVLAPVSFMTNIICFTANNPENRWNPMVFDSGFLVDLFHKWLLLSARNSWKRNQNFSKVWQMETAL